MTAYDDIADIYDTIYSWKDYEGEARRLHATLRRAGAPRHGRLLDVACGTGSHLTYLRRWYDVTGVDGNARMLAQARRKLPGVPLLRARMQSFRRKERFDAVLCLFSAIGYARTADDMRRTVRNLARHLAPGGVLVIEPWIEPSEYLPNHVHLLSVDQPGVKLARITLGRRAGNRSIMEMHYLVGTRRGVRYLHDRHVLTMVPLVRLRTWLAAEGLTVRTLPRGFTGRGLLVARRPKVERKARTGRRRTVTLPGTVARTRGMRSG